MKIKECDRFAQMVIMLYPLKKQSTNFWKKNYTCYFQPSSPLNGERSPHENGPDKKKDGPSSPRSDGSSHASTPSSKNKDVSVTRPIFVFKISN